MRHLFWGAGAEGKRDWIGEFQKGSGPHTIKIFKFFTIQRQIAEKFANNRLKKENPSVQIEMRLDFIGLLCYVIYQIKDRR